MTTKQTLEIRMDPEEVMEQVISKILSLHNVAPTT